MIGLKLKVQWSKSICSAVLSIQQYILSILSKQMFQKFELESDIIQMYKPYQRVGVPLKTFTIGGERFQIDQYYLVEYKMVHRRYGGIFLAKDSHVCPQDPQDVVIKLSPFLQIKLIIRQQIRDLRMQRLLQHENILPLINVVLPASRQKIGIVYTVREKMDRDLHQIILSDQDITNEHVSFFLYQILRGLKYIHSAGITHRFLNSRHILINTNCDLKICHLSSSIRSSNESDRTHYNQNNRNYSSPESIISQMERNQTMDIWSTGCIFAEMFLRKIFLPGTNIQEQLGLILNLVGMPKQQYLDSIQQSSKNLILKTYQKIANKRKFAKDWNEILPFADPLAIDLMKKMLAFDPRELINAADALQHLYFSDLHLESDEPTRNPISALEFEFEDDCTLTSEQLKDILYEEIILSHFDAFRQDYETRREKGESLIAHIRNNSNAKHFNEW